MEKIRAFRMVLSRGVVVAGENATAKEIAQLMKRHDIGAVVILRKEKLVGIVSERDIVRRVVADDVSAKTEKAKSFMTKDVVTAEFREGLKEIYQQLCNSKFRHLPIMDRGRLVGIASQRDVLYGLINRNIADMKNL